MKLTDVSWMKSTAHVLLALNPSGLVNGTKVFLSTKCTSVRGFWLGVLTPKGMKVDGYIDFTFAYLSSFTILFVCPDLSTEGLSSPS